MCDSSSSQVGTGNLPIKSDFSRPLFKKSLKFKTWMGKCVIKSKTGAYWPCLILMPDRTKSCEVWFLSRLRRPKNFRDALYQTSSNKLKMAWGWRPESQIILNVCFDNLYSVQRFRGDFPNLHRGAFYFCW